MAAADDHALIRALERAFLAAGGRVTLDPGARNLVRPRRDDELGTHPFVVEAEGLPNLLHEFVHFAQLGRLETDHGYDYARIPFDTSSAEERGWLWEELACCAVSCAYLASEPDRIRPWFREQVGIQHHFFGFERNDAFRVHVDTLLKAHAAEATRVEERAYDASEALLAPHAPARIARPPHRLGIGELWAAL